MKFGTLKKSIAVLLGVCVLAFAPVVAAMGGKAMADDNETPTTPTSVTSPTVWTIAEGPICGGRVNGLAQTKADKPGMLEVQVTGGFFGISDGGPCWVEVAVHWHNTTTNAQGIERGRVSGLMIPSTPIQVLSKKIQTGAGKVNFWLVPVRPALLVAPTEITVP